MTRTLLAPILLAALSLPISLHAQEPQPPSLADIAKKAQEERAKRAEEQRVKPDKTEKADSADGAGRTDKAAKEDKAARADKEDKEDKSEKADDKGKKVYTNADLPRTTSTTSAAPATNVTPAAEPAASVPAETGETKAKRVLAFELDVLAYKIRDWFNGAAIVAKMCDRGSYLGLTGGSLQGHVAFCKGLLAEGNGKRTNINQLSLELEGKAAREGIAPGVARDLVKAMGWE